MYDFQFAGIASAGAMSLADMSDDLRIRFSINAFPFMLESTSVFGVVTSNIVEEAVEVDEPHPVFVNSFVEGVGPEAKSVELSITWEGLEGIEERRME